jgi:transposase
MRVIAESTKKTDRLDAQTLAEFLALGLIPRAYRPNARQRAHRTLVRHRVKCQQRVSRLKCKIRHLAATYNADHAQLLQADQLEQLRQRSDLSATDRFILEEYLEEYAHALTRLQAAQAELKRFAAQGAPLEQAQRALLQSAPGVGAVVSEVVLAELADVERFPSLKDATAYAGLVPGQRQSDEKTRDLGITRKGSALLRWAMVEAAWVAVTHSSRWRGVYEGLKRRRQSKRAIIAVARRLLAVLVSMLKNGTEYRWSVAELKDRERRAARRRAQKAAQKANVA